MELEKIFETIKEYSDKIEQQKKLDFIECLENIKGTEKIISKTKELGIPTHLLLSEEFEKMIPNDNRIRNFLTVIPHSLVKNQMFFFWQKENTYNVI